MSYLGQPIAVEVTGNGNNRFEPGELVIFYAEPYQGRYQTSNVYWFTYGGAAGPRMTTRSVTPTGTEPLVTTITQTLHVEFDRQYRSDYARPKEADHWFDLPLSVDSATTTVVAATTYDLALDDALTVGNVRLRSELSWLAPTGRRTPTSRSPSGSTAMPSARINGKGAPGTKPQPRCRPHGLTACLIV